MKKIYLFIALSSLLVGAFAQTDLSLSYPGGAISADDTITFSTDINTSITSGAYIFVHNNGTTELDIKCKKEEIALIPGSENSFCWDVCLTSDVFISTTSIVIPAGDSTNESGFSGEYYPHGNLGDTYIRYTFFEKNNEDHKASVMVVYHAGPVSVNHFAQNHNRLNIVPNPASTQVNIDYTFNSGGNNLITIKNIIGETVYTSGPLYTSGKIGINISDFTDGIYFVTFTSDNIPQCTKKMVVKH